MSVRTYFIEVNCGDKILHPLKCFVEDDRTSELIWIEVHTIGDRKPEKEYTNESRRVYASHQLRGRVIECPWAPAEDAQHFSFGDWEYSPLALEEIKNRKYPNAATYYEFDAQ